MSQQKSDAHGPEVGRKSKRFGRRLLISAAVAGAGLVLIGVVQVSRSRESGPAPKEVATSFVEAVGARDAEQAVSYLADDADIAKLISSVGAQGVEGTVEEFRRLLSLLDATGYKQTHSSCEEVGSSSAGSVSCTFGYHNLGSDEIARGPFGGSSFFLTVRDGEIVQARMDFETGEFSGQMWEPFAAWVSTAYPKDAAVMYGDATYSGMRLTEESIELWARHTREYVKEVGVAVSVTKPRVSKVDYTLDLSTGVMTPLPKAILRSLAASVERSAYAASSDGSRLAYVGTGDDGSPQIFVAGIDGTGARQVTHDSRETASPAWSPDGTRIAYVGYGTGKIRNLFVVDMETGKSRQVTDDVRDVWDSQFTPDGLSLVFTRGPDCCPLLRTVPVAGGKGTILIRPEDGLEDSGQGSLSPDGSLVTFLGGGSPIGTGTHCGPCRLVANADGTNRRVVSGGCWYTIPAGTWSPDGRRIVCSDDSNGIVVVDIATGAASRVAKGRRAIWLDKHTLLVDA